MSDKQICPICHREASDMRHVSVECFYDVQEYVPDAEQTQAFVEIPEEGSYLGRTRRYKDGTRDDWQVASEEEAHGIKRVNMVTVQVPIGDIRLHELSLYRVDCCKSCRYDFLRSFQAWRDGLFRNERADTNGIYALTSSEVAAMKGQQHEL